MNKIYDGNTRKNVKLISENILAGDNIDFIDTTANFKDKNVGTNKPVTVTG